MTIEDAFQKRLNSAYFRGEDAEVQMLRDLREEVLAIAEVEKKRHINDWLNERAKQKMPDYLKDFFA